MDEYIKRKDAKKAILDACGCDYRCMAETECNGMCDIHAGIVWGAVDNIPAADVRENVRGKWIFEKGDGMTCDDGWYCSNCKHGFHTNVPYFSEYNFCPNCGADMKGC